MRGSAISLALMAVSTGAAAQSVAYYSGQVTTTSRAVAPGQSAPVLTVPFAPITVCMAVNAQPFCSGTTPIYSDAAMKQPIAQPLKADAQGNYGFFAPVGRYVALLQLPGTPTITSIPVTVGGMVGPGGAGGQGTVTKVNGILPDNTGNVTVPVGTVKSVNSLSPDGNGNLTLTAAQVGALPTNAVIPYTQISGAPTIPTNTNQLTNGAGFITSAQVPVKTVNNLQPDANANISVPIIDQTARNAAAASCQQNGTNCPSSGGAGNPASPGNSIQLANAGATGFASTPNVTWLTSGNPNTGINATSTQFYSNANNAFFYPQICPTSVDSGHTIVFGGLGANSQVDCYSGRAARLEAHQASLYDFNSMGAPNLGGAPLNLGRTLGINMHSFTLQTNGPGRNIGTGVNAWFVAVADTSTHVASAAGIAELHKDVMQGNKYTGDISVNRRNFNYHPGGNDDPSGEGNQHDYTNMTPMDTYKATSSAAYAQGTTQIVTTQTNNGCGAAQATGGDNDGNCSGGGGILVDLASAGLIATGNVTAYSNFVATLDPSSMSTPFTAGVRATVSGGIPDTTNFQTGDSITLTFSNPTGTLPASGATGYLCAFGLTNGVSAETMPYTMASSTTATVTQHRYAQGGSKFGGDAAVYFNACPAASATANYAPDGGNRTATRVVGFPSANTMEVADYRTGTRFGGFLDFGGSFTLNAGFLANHPGANGTEVRRAAEVIDTLNHSTLQHDGTMLISANDMTLASGDPVEEAYRPAIQTALRNDYAIARLVSTGVDKAYENIYLGGDWDRGIDLISFQSVGTYANPAIASSGLRPPLQSIIRMRSVLGGHDGGMYYDLFQSNFAPLDALLRIDGCAPGDATQDCSGGTPTTVIFQGVGHANTDSGVIAYNMNQGQIGMHAKSMLFTTQNNGGIGILGGLRVDNLTVTGTCTGCGSGSTPGGATNSVQYNNAGALGGVSPNSTATPQYLSQTSSGAPVMKQIASTDVSGLVPTVGGTVQLSGGSYTTTVPTGVTLCTVSTAGAAPSGSVIPWYSLSGTSLTLNGNGADYLSYICMKATQ